MTPRCGDVYDPDHREAGDVCLLPAGHGDWHSNTKGAYWEDEK